MQLANGLVLLLAVAASSVVPIESAKNIADRRSRNEGVKSRDQLIIYDPKSGKQIEPVQYLPFTTGSKRNPAKPNGNFVELPQLWNPCNCFSFLCSCCLGIRLGEAFNNRICVIIEYNPSQMSIELRINFNRRTVAQFGFSARNPPAYCVPVLMPLPVFACLRLYDVRAVAGNVQICIALMLNAFVNTVFEFNFECIRFGVGGVRFTKHGQLETEASLEDDDDEIILKGDEERRQNIVLEENYSGISVEEEQKSHPWEGPMVRKGKRGRK